MSKILSEKILQGNKKVMAEHERMTHGTRQSSREYDPQQAKETK